MANPAVSECKSTTARAYSQSHHHLFRHAEIDNNVSTVIVIIPQRRGARPHHLQNIEAHHTHTTCRMAGLCGHSKTRMYGFCPPVPTPQKKQKNTLSSNLQER